MRSVNDFGLVPLKKEGQSIYYDDKSPDYKEPQYETKWLEVPVPAAIYHDVDKMVDEYINIYLKENGFTKE